MKRLIIRKLIKLGILKDRITYCYDIETVRRYPYHVDAFVWVRHKYFPENDYFTYMDIKTVK